MFGKIINTGLQKVINRLNQFNKVTEEYGNLEELYSRIYMEHTIAVLKENFGENVSLKVLDAGCGTGMMAIELAKLGHEVTGIEIHQSSLDVAKRQAEKAGVSANWISGDLYPSLQKLESESFDVVMCYGVLYTCTKYKEIIEEFGRLLKPGGVLFATFRSRFYYITTLLRQKQYKKAPFVINNSEGMLKLASIPAYYNWQTADEVKDLYTNNDITVTRLIPVGVFSGTGYDGMAAIVDSEQAGSDIMNSVLYELETSELKECLGASRFMFAIGKKV